MSTNNNIFSEDQSIENALNYGTTLHHISGNFIGIINKISLNQTSAEVARTSLGYSTKSNTQNF